MDKLSESWAFIGGPSDSIYIGEGPFTPHATAPTGKTAFYHNNFSLTLPAPWLEPKRLHQISRNEFSSLFPKAPLPEVAWKEPNVESFAAVFKEVSEALSSKSIQKSVPVVTERAPIPELVFRSLPPKLFPLHKNLTPYGFFNEGSGHIGASPEYLLQTFEGKLKTMALAGTAKEEEREVFTFDQKEIQEHEFVAQNLLDTLTPLGMTRKHERNVLSLGSLIHFHTAIDVELYQSHQADDLIKQLHPTPALGPLPRTPETMANLHKWRNQLKCPSCFGAPFGLYHEGKLDLLVAIRMLAYEKGTLLLPSGCGIIEASRLTNEWRELKLKRAAVKKYFGL